MAVWGEEYGVQAKERGGHTSRKQQANPQAPAKCVLKPREIWLSSPDTQGSWQEQGWRRQPARSLESQMWPRPREGWTEGTEEEPQARWEKPPVTAQVQTLRAENMV